MALEDPPPRDALPGLLKLPNELLCGIVSDLSIPDIRQLGRVSRRLYFFAREYLVRYRYKSGLHTLPNEILLEVVQLLGSQKTRSSFARTSQKFYPIVMNYVVCHDIWHGGSSLLHYASKRGLDGMAEGILYLGGDVETRSESDILIASEATTPLITAAGHGHVRTVRLFLEVGARQHINGFRAPLAVALAEGHEDVAIILSQELEARDTLSKGGSTLLRCACEAKATNLVRLLLKRNPGFRDKQIVRDCNIALYGLLDENVCKGEFLKRELLEDDFNIATTLVQQSAESDICIKPTESDFETIRHIASRHPDPRVRNLLLSIRAAKQTVPTQNDVHIDLSILNPREGSAYHQVRSKAVSLEQMNQATLWDFLEKSNTDMSVVFERDSAPRPSLDGYVENCILGRFDLQALIARRAETMRLQANSEPPTFLNDPPLSSESQLGNLTSILRRADQNFWARMPLSVTRSDRASEKPTERPKIAETFPQLEGTVPAGNEREVAFWSRFSQNEKKPRASNETKEMMKDDEGKGKQTPRSKKSKKKQWAPLRI
jgi:hypothetical protein